MGEHRRIKPVAERVQDDRPELEFVLNRGYHGVIAREANTDRDGEWIHCERPVEVRQ